MSKFIRKWPIASLLLLSTTATTASGYIAYNNIYTKKNHTYQTKNYVYQQLPFRSLLSPIKMLFPIVHLEQNHTITKKKDSNDINNNNNSSSTSNQLTDIFETAKANLFDIQDQLTRSILAKFPLIDDFQDLSPTELRERMATLWETITLDDCIDSIKDVNDIDTNPELGMDAVVRYGLNISKGEQRFIEHRKEKQRLAFAKFIGVDPMEVELDDIPVVAIASSGGGMRALLGLTGYLNGMKKAGILDCVMYIAGVSGSTWAMSLYYSTLVKCDPEAMVNYLKPHVSAHFANFSRVLSLAAASPQNTKLLLQGIGQRYLQHNTVNLVDLFGALIGSSLFTISKEINDEEEKDDDSNKNETDEIKKDSIKKKGKKMVELLLNKNEMKLSSQMNYFEDGSQPMPIYCVVREDVSVQEQKSIEGNEDYKEEATNDGNQEKQADNEEPHMYQWFEFTSFEMGSEDINAWIPMWAFGRKFENGKNTERLPEQRIDSLLGMFGSAFAASVKHFYQEIRHFLPTSIIELTDETIGRYEKTLSTLHPISPAIYPNPFYHAHNKKLTPKDSSITDSENILLMDAGMDNNIPFYPLLRKDRQVDVILAIDLSADIQTAPHFDRAEGYVKRRRISGWPLNMGWKSNNKEEEKDNVSDTIKDMNKKKMKKIEKEDKEKCQDESIPMEEKDSDEDINNSSNTVNEISQGKQKYALGPCTVFASSAVTKFDDNNSDHLITLIYFPFICNEKYDPDFDPQTAEYCSTANFVYDSEQVDRVTELAEVNITQNIDQIRSVLHGAWQRKKQKRFHIEEIDRRANIFLYP